MSDAQKTSLRHIFLLYLIFPKTVINHMGSVKASIFGVLTQYFLTSKCGYLKLSFGKFEKMTFKT